MTREEAIENIKLIRFNAAITNAKSFKEALDMAIEALSQPSLPSNLDEAAENYAYNNWEDNDYHTGASEGLPFDAIGHTEKCFKAGAEWMAGQGVSYQDTISADKTIPVLPMKDVSDMGLDYSDEVVVQIRKKQ